MERDRLGRFMKGKNPSLKTEFKKGNVPWNRGVTGYSNSNKGKPRNPNSGYQKGHPNYHKAGNKWSMKSKIKFSSTQQNIRVEDWNGFKSDINHRLRTSSKYKIWRELIFLRDNFTCQNNDCEFCNNKIGTMLNAHHINSIVEDPEEMFNINNGITYCAEFHLKGDLHKGIAKRQLNFIGGKNYCK